jgi:dTDP-4-dehydrorhamnose reductase
VKTAVVGSNGQLGQDVVQALAAAGHEVCGLTHKEIELFDAGMVARTLQPIAPAVVINTAAMHNVEQCELDPAKAFQVNTIGVRNLAVITRDLGAVLVHISTDYVFDGNKQAPYLEHDEALPLNVYGNSKLAGEQFVRTINPRHFVLRTSALFGTSPCRAKGGLNFVELMLKLARERGQMRVVDSESVSPTSTAELAEQIAALMKCECYGLYHATAEGSCSWFGFAEEILSASGVPAKLSVAAPHEFPSKVPRPRYSVLENAALKRAGLNRFGSWQQGLHRYLEKISAGVGVA